MTTTREQHTFAVVAQVFAVLDERGVSHAVVGAVALAAHGYVRATADVDIGVVLNTLRELDDLGKALSTAIPDVSVAVRWPDAEDPLGGVIDLTAPTMRPIQVINFVNPLGVGDNPGREGVIAAKSVGPDGGRARVVDVPHLVALLLDRGTAKSKGDVVELLAATDSPLDVVDVTCARFKLSDEWNELKPEVEARRARA